MKLNIINQSSEIDLTPYQIAFMEHVLDLSRVIMQFPDDLYHRKKSEPFIFQNNFSLNIPIYLVDEDQFKKIKEIYYDENRYGREPELVYPDEKEYISEEELHGRDIIGIKNKDKHKGKKGQTVHSEALGLYFPNYSVLGKIGMPQPAIFLCMHTISKEAKDHNEFLYLTTLVLLHELGHHIMNRGNYKPKDEFYEWMEESFAECLALNMIKKVLDAYKHHNYGFDDHNINQFVEFLEYSKYNIIRGPKNYQLGYYLFMFGQTSKYNYSSRWTWDKQELCKPNYKTVEKKAWLNYVKYDVINDKGAKLEQLYKALFD